MTLPEENNIINRILPAMTANIQGKQDEAEQIYLELIESLKQTGDGQSEAGDLFMVYFNLADMKIGQRKYDEALAYWQSFLEIDNEYLVSISLKAPALVKVSEIYIGMEKFDLAVDHLEQAIEIARKESLTTDAYMLCIPVKMASDSGAKWPGSQEENSMRVRN